MDLLSVVLSLKTKSIEAAVFCAACLITLCQPSALAANSVDTVNQIEQRLFFTNYPQEDLSSRLVRLENRVFGQSMPGTTDERISKLSAIVQPPKEDSPPAINNSQRTETKSATANATNNASSSDVQEQDCVIERARVSVLAAKEEEITSLLAEGVQLWHNKQGQQALEKFEQVVRLDPQNAEAHFSMGIIEEAAGNLVEALSSYRLASKARPDNREYKEALATIEKKFSSQQKVAEAKSELRQLAEDAVAAYRRGEYLSALDLYKTLDTRSPRQALVKYNIGTIYLMIKQPEKALAYYDEAQRLEPNNQRYTDACNKLKPIIGHNVDDLADKPVKTRHNKSTGALAAASASAQDVLSSYGIIGRSASQGIYITTIGIASKASAVGLLPGDIIKAVNGTVVTHPKEVNEILMRKGAGDPVRVMIQRDKSLTQIVL